MADSEDKKGKAALETPADETEHAEPTEETEHVEDEHEHENDEYEHEGEAEAAGSGAHAGKKKKHKKKKGKTAAVAAPAAAAEAAPGSVESDVKAALDSLPPAQVAELLKLNPAISQEIAHGSSSGSSSSSVSAEAALAALRKLSLNDIVTGLAASGKNAKDMASYKFWQTQPVPRFGEDEASGGALIEEGPIREQTVDEVPKEPAKLIDGFEWVTVDLQDDTELQEVYDLLSGHFVEDGEAMFRFRYSKAILKWAMMSPGWTKDWHIGVRASQSRKLVAFISAIPLELRIRDKILHASEVNFLVIHKKLRSKRLAPVLIKEITRLCNVKGVFQALYTAGVVLPKPVSTARYYHRSINWQKLYEIGFSPLPPNSKPQFQIRKYALPDRTAIKGLRELEARDIDAVQSLLTRYLARYDMAMEFTREEVEHWMLDKKLPGDEQVVYSYVVETDNKITDFFSFYCLDSSIINNSNYKVIRAAYLFYYATEVGLTTPIDKPALKARLNELMSDSLILAKKHKFDVFNALSIMDNALFLQEQKYGPGDGQLHYYLFNYRANPITGGVDRRNQLDEDRLSGIGFVMM